MLNNIKFTKNEIVILFAVVACFNINILTYFSRLSTLVYMFSQLFFTLYSIFIIVQTKKIYKIDYCIFVFCAIGFFATFINGLDPKTYIMEMIRFLSLIYILRLGIELNPRFYFKFTSFYLGLLTILNTIISMVIYPNPILYDGPSPIFLLGGDNTSIRIYILTMLFCVLSLKKQFINKIFTFVVWLSFGLFCFLQDLGTGKICFILITLGILLFIIANIRLPKKTVFLIILLHLLCFFILMGGTKYITIFQKIIVDLLHRDITLTDRTIIWQITLDKFFQNPMLGYGYVSGKQFESMLPFIIGVNAHNTYLMILYIGGIPLFFVFAFMLNCSRKIYDSSKHKQLCSIIPIVLFTMMLRAQVEGGDSSYLVYIFYLMYFTYKIEPYVEGNYKFRYKLI